MNPDLTSWLEKLTPEQLELVKYKVTVLAEEKKQRLKNPERYQPSISPIILVSISQLWNGRSTFRLSADNKIETRLLRLEVAREI
ncbi:hypothetical protein [Neptuniibacter sp.]|uniref:hypothetical protein n=1 Tax=Neptuniibacter sp. TaxID=1962643 RepID=UPI003B5C1C63